MTPNFRAILEEKAHYMFLMGFPGLTLFLPDEYEFQQVRLNSDLQTHMKCLFRPRIWSLKSSNQSECLPFLPEYPLRAEE